MYPPANTEGVARSEVVRVWLLGGFRVSVGSRTVEEGAWRLRKAAALVKLLALSPGHRLHREQAMDLLWPDLGKRSASNNLRQVVHAARRILAPTGGSRYLVSNEESLVLCPGGNLWVDIEAFEEAAQRARRSRDPAAHRGALDLYAGELLPEDRYEEWAAERREGLRRLHIDLSIELGELHEVRGEHGRAVEALHRALSEEPSNEEAHASLMRLYALSGREGEALAQYERLREVISERLGTEPSRTTRRLRDEIEAGAFPSNRTAVPPPEESPGTGNHNLPASRTTFVGRGREMVEIKRMLAMTGILTLTGVGGCGKTRLALELGRGLVGAYPDGVWLAELAPLSEEALVFQAVAEALTVAEQPGRPLLDSVLDALRDKEMLLILDNCEHLIAAATRLADTLLRSCPRLRVIATSREALNVDGEVLWQVGPLSVPGQRERPTVDELRGYESARLFAERALFVERTLYGSSGFVLSTDNAPSVAEICWRLEGIPLALELAAAWVGTVPVEQISQRLKVSLGLLKGGRTLSRRQQTLRGALDWSFDLLSEPEQTLFGRLSVFAGGWTLEAAEAVGAGGEVEQAEVLELLWELVNKSLVVAEAGTQATAARYRMLEPIRQYAQEKREGSGEAGAVQHRHAAFFLALAEEAGPELEGPQQESWTERLESEHDNLRAALAWVLDREAGELGLRFGGALWRFWYNRGYLGEGARWLEEVLAGGDKAASLVRVRTLEGMGWLTQIQGEVERAEATYEEMLELSRELGDKDAMATALNSLGTLAAARGDNERARKLLEENMAVLGDLNEQSTATKLKRYHVLNLLGVLALQEEGEPARATALWEESLALAREVGDVSRIGSILMNLGFATLVQGDYERARTVCGEALALSSDDSRVQVFAPEAWVNMGLAELGQGERKQAAASFSRGLALAQEVGTKVSAMSSLEAMASLAGALGKATRAARLWGAVEAARRVSGIALSPIEQALHEPYLAPARSRLGEAAWEEALAAGRAMSLEGVAEFALSLEEFETSTVPVPEKRPAREPTDRLTSREQDVALLVARGLTNRQIATRLNISERTVENHVASIFNKLGLRSRVQVASWATEQRLLTTPDRE